jgi:outer membrane receptor for ferrienterochelin and colicins
VLGQAMIGPEFLVDVDMIERVEIVRGPSSSLYGAEAFFAVINVITRKPPQLRGLELSFAPASFGTYQGRVSYGGQYRGLNMLLSGTFYNSQGQTLFFPEFNRPATNNGITRGTDYESYKHILATFTFHGFTLQGLFSTRDRGVPTAYFGAVFNDPADFNLDSHQYVDLGYKHLIGKWQLDAQTGFDQARLQAPVPEPPAMAGGPVVLDTYSFRGNWWTGEVRASRDLFERNHLTLGSEIKDNLRQDQGDLLNPPDVFSSEPNSSLITALYVQDEFGITSRLTLDAGVRYDHYSTFGGTANPRLGLIYHLFHPTTLKLLYGRAFRAPEPFELTPNFGAFYDDDVKLKPETIRSEEVIVEQGIGPHCTLTGSLFRNDIDDLISVETNASDGQLIYRNSGDTVAKGIAIEFAGRTTRGLEGRLSYGFTHAVGSQPEPVLANSPQHLGKLNLSYPVVQQRLFASVDAQYTSSVQTLAGNTLNGFSVFNVTLLGHTLGKHLDLSTSVYNIFGKKYFNPGRPEDPEDKIQQDGRSFRVKITSRF